MYLHHGVGYCDSGQSHDTSFAALESGTRERVVRAQTEGMAENELSDRDSADGSESFSCSEESEDDEKTQQERRQRISLGGLFTSQGGESTQLDRVVLPGQEKRKFAETDAECQGAADDAMSAEGVGVRWFKGSHIPADPREVLDWHPNRVRAMLVTELHDRLQHLTPKRHKTKRWDPISEFHSLLRGDTPIVSKKGTHGDHWRGRDFYVRVINYVTGDGIRNVRKATSQTWQKVSNEDRHCWYLLHRIAHDSRIAPILDMPKKNEKSKLEAASAEYNQGGTKHGPQTWSGYGFVLSWNTDLGQDDPDVIKLLQSGKVGEDLFRSMKGLTLYQEAFTDLWEHANQVAMRKKLGTVNIGMEHSPNGDHEARVHFHGFLGPDLRSGVGFGWNPVLSEITSEEVKWRGIYPNIKPTRPQKKSWTQIYQAVATGSYYVAGPKIGSILQRSTFKPIEDRAVFNYIKERHANHRSGKTCVIYA